jgi:hypothetical protein
MTRKPLGTALVVVASLIGGYFLLAFEASVPSGSGDGRIMNIGLMAERQNWIIVSGILGLAGLLMILIPSGDMRPAAQEIGMPVAIGSHDAPNITTNPAPLWKSAVKIGLGIAALCLVFAYFDDVYFWLVWKFG